MSSNNRLMKIYTDTILDTKELLTPEQMDNDIINHIKDNLKKHYEKKCYKQYGYINKIYKVNEIEETLINPEDIQSSQQFKVKFSCQLFFVINEREIICKMDRINPKINTAINGPVKTIISLDLINKQKFFVDTYNCLRIKETTELLKTGMYVKILINGIIFSDKSIEIISKGILLDLATPEEIKQYYDIENKDEEINDYDII
jgi:DNA-directed RNA polymerase subunit E'/Rpb7